MQAVQIDRSVLSRIELVDTPSPVLAAGSIRLRIESFAVTANTVTYAVVGERLRYWDFFPAGADVGVVPVWGHAGVEQSEHPAVRAGDRLFGFLPMASHVDLVVAAATPERLQEGAAHRAWASPFYNRYERLASTPDSAREAMHEAIHEALQPLFATGYLLERAFRRDNWFGASRLIITSASSKTALSLAHEAATKSPAIHRVALTSAGNERFVMKTGLYDEVVSYDDVQSLDSAPSLLVDLAGNPHIRAEAYRRLGSDLRFVSAVGATHAPRLADGAHADALQPATVPFFAPREFAEAAGEAGAPALGAAVAERLRIFAARASGFLSVDVRKGLAAAPAAYLEIVAGVADPASIVIIRP